jgi:hypothetical protein
MKQKTNAEMETCQGILFGNNSEISFPFQNPTPLGRWISIPFHNCSWNQLHYDE